MERYFQTDHLSENIRERSVRGGIVTLSAQGIKFLLGLISTATLARLLRPQDFGLLAMVTSIIAFLHIFKELGLADATVQRSAITHEQVSFLFWVNVTLGLVVTLVVLALAPVIAWFYGEPRLFAITMVLSLNFLVSGLTVQHQALLRRQMQFKVLAIRDVIALACAVAAGITLGWLGFGYWAIVAMPVTTNLASALLLWTICTWRPGRIRRGVGARGMLAFGGNLTGATFLNYLTVNFDNVLIGRVLGSTPLGIYSKAYGLLMLPIAQINGPMASVLLPGLSRLQNDAFEYSRLFVGAVRSISLVTVPIVVFSFFFAHDIVLVLLGRKWLAVAPVFQLMAPAALFGAISFVPGWLCQSLGRARRQFHYALVAAPVSIAGFVIGIKWGIAGVAVSYSISFSILFWLYVGYASKDTPVRFCEVATGFFSAALPAVAAAVIVWWLRGWWNYPVHSAVTLTLFGCLFCTIYISTASLDTKNRMLILTGLASARAKLGL